jgi:hypothetical protein
LAYRARHQPPPGPLIIADVLPTEDDLAAWFGIAPQLPRARSRPAKAVTVDQSPKEGIDLIAEPRAHFGNHPRPKRAS